MSGIRVTALMDANTLTGPARNFLRLSRLVRSRSDGQCEISLVTVVRAGVAEPADHPFIAAARAIPIHVDVIQERRRFDRQVLMDLRRILRERSPDLIQSHSLKAHLLTCLARPERTRWLAYHHGYTTEDWKMRLYNQLDRWSLPKADRVVTVCKPFADMLARRGVRQDRIRVVPNAIESEFRGRNAGPALRRDLGIPEDSRVLLAIGRLSPEKGHRDLIEAVRILSSGDHALAFRLVLVGDGSERTRLMRQIEAAGLRDRVSLTGHRPDPVPYYELADAFVLPSHSEGSSNVLLEAMVAGLPIVACAVGGVGETVEHEHSALLVNARDPSALAAAIRRVLEQPDLARSLGNSARDAVRARYSPEGSCDAILRIYGELLPDRIVAPV